MSRGVGRMLVAAGVMVLVGCGPAPSPDFECVVGEEARPCNRREVARAEEDFAEVERRYRAADDDIDRMMLTAGQEDNTPNLDQYAADQFLEGAKEMGESFRAQGEKTSQSISADSVHLQSFSGDQMTILTCADARDVATVDADTGEVIHMGHRAAVEVDAELRNGEWLLVSAKNVEESTCQW